MEKPEKYIPKKDLIDMGWYIGFCRNTHVARWNKHDERFYFPRDNFKQFGLESITHFEDVKDKGTDGFVPLQLIENPKSENWFKDFKNEIGY